MDKLKYLQRYIELRIDLISQNPKRWLGNSFYQIFTFDYYYKNCVLDAGGKYDFTSMNYKSQQVELPIIKSVNNTPINFNQKRITKRLSYSSWMGTEFNFKETIIKHDNN